MNEQSEQTKTRLIDSYLGSGYNPDVLLCLANLSNDEVFTPPDVANQMLDILPQELFEDPNATFLDPVCKSGVFLREIAKRLVKGLENKIPDLGERVDHIMKKQLFGVAITELTSLVARRTLYCSKYPNCAYSIAKFDDPEGNIRFRNIEHTWVNGKCQYCGAAESEYGDEKRKGKETHAYEFIHSEEPESIFDMKFDVIIGNPPYQMSDGGAQKSATPIYHIFVEIAKKLEPSYISMIIPARWYSGGKGLDSFRRNMLNDNKIKEIHDFPETSDCFPGVNIRGGVCYFLWDKSYSGDCRVVNHKGTDVLDESDRPLLEKNSESFIRYNKAIAILRKVQKFQEDSFSKLVSARKPFGLATNFSDFSLMENANDKIVLYRFRENGYVSAEKIGRNYDWVDKHKVFVPYASPGSDDYPHLILSKPIVAGKNTACTETYLVVGPFESKSEANNVASYMRTQFFRFMLLLLKNTQHITQKIYRFAPIQDFSIAWSDEKLYEQYNITQEEIDFIDSLIKPLAD
jgi:site-specific DNA-methyltransferase (adenine-specific)